MFWGSLIAAGIGLIGSLVASNQQDKGFEQQVSAADKANRISNSQWQQEFQQSKLNSDRNYSLNLTQARQNDQALLNSKLAMAPGLSSRLIDIWGGK